MNLQPTTSVPVHDFGQFVRANELNIELAEELIGKRTDLDADDVKSIVMELAKIEGGSRLANKIQQRFKANPDWQADKVDLKTLSTAISEARRATKFGAKDAADILMLKMLINRLELAVEGDPFEDITKKVKDSQSGNLSHDAAAEILAKRIEKKYGELVSDLLKQNCFDDVLSREVPVYGTDPVKTAGVIQLHIKVARKEAGFDVTEDLTGLRPENFPRIWSAPEAKTIRQLTAKEYGKTNVLLEALADTDDDVRQAAIQGLARIRSQALDKEQAKRVAGHLLHVYISASGSLKQEALNALVKLIQGDPVPISSGLAEQVRNEQDQPTVQALKELVSTLYGGAVEHFGQAFKDPDHEVSGSAVEALGVFAPRKGEERFFDPTSPERAIRSLFLALIRRDAGVHEAVRQSLGEVAQAHAEDIIPPLSQAFKVEVRTVCFAMLNTLAKFATTHPKKIIPVLTQALRKEELHDFGTKILRDLSETHPAEIIPALALALKDDSVLVRSFVAQHLVAFGQALAGVVVPALIEALSVDPDPNIRAIVVAAVDKFSKTHAEVIVPALIQTLDHDVDARVRGEAALSLGVFAEMHADVVFPVLMQTLSQDQDAHVRGNALLALGNFANTHAAVIVPVLIEMLNHKSDDVRGVLVQVLREGVDLQHENIVRALVQELNNPDDVIRRSAALLLGVLDETSGAAFETVTLILRQMRDDQAADPFLRNLAAECLEDMSRDVDS